jgi:flagellar motor component MotA
LSIAIKDENVPPRAVAMAHILIDEAKLIIVLSGGLSVIIAPTPAKTLAPITTPKEIKKLFITLARKLDNIITVPYKKPCYKV